MNQSLHGKKILIFGGTGSLGRALIRRLLETNTLTVFSRDEAKHWTIRNEIQSNNLQLMVGDIRDFSRVEETLIKVRPDIVILASALKQVDTCELSPFESIQTNIIGIKNVVDAVEKNLPVLHGSTGGNLESVLMVSTDKACAPVNVYGMCKAIAERLVTSRSRDYASPRFVAVRYGNVLDSRGSIIPLFRHQADHARAFTLTHADMTRFLMTLDDSIDLIIQTLNDAKSGETWLPKLRAMRIKDLADIFSDRYQKPVQIIGMRPGEKIHEALISEAESVRTRDIGTHYVMSPSYVEVGQSAKLFAYTSSDDVLSRNNLNAYMESIGMLDLDLKNVQGATIEEIRIR